MGWIIVDNFVFALGQAVLLALGLHRSFSSKDGALGGETEPLLGNVAHGRMSCYYETSERTMDSSALTVGGCSFNHRELYVVTSRYDKRRSASVVFWLADFALNGNHRVFMILKMTPIPLVELSSLVTVPERIPRHYVFREISHFPRERLRLTRIECIKVIVFVAAHIL